ncbi:type IV pilus biogenesis/stability protein PilW [Vibrio sp. ZSDE26]|uniref:Type IV pilus biogenesis/stability protein PilW n=1 Tax=Vibrio amylolyticus TaxID=2847292 RepID=A0A9X1XMM2_9VIBR|nr:type IV pilus biogenesis/stability protein PilW [Vibrio amylolyticus]MCK6265140.1 type IV pilus biogenesis/stability protein PilW [Vibrio amylolyticus]
MKTILPSISLLSLIGCITVTEGGPPAATATSVEMAETRVTLGLGYLEQGNMMKARENFEKALKHAPNYYRSQLSMAHYYDTVGEVKSADNLYKKALRQQPNNGNVLNNYGTFLCKQGEFKHADELFNRAIKQPYYYLISGSYENAALCALKSGDTVKAKGYFKRTLDHDPNRVRSTLQLAKIEIEDHEFTEARIRLMRFHQSYGLQQASLSLLVELETKAGNPAIRDKYQHQLEKLL